MEVFHGILKEKLKFLFPNFLFLYISVLQSVMVLSTNILITVELSYFFSQFAQGDQNSPGVIPLAIKDVFSIIQDVSALVHFILFDLCESICTSLPIFLGV